MLAVLRYLWEVDTVFDGSDTIEAALCNSLPSTPHVVLTKECTMKPTHSPTGSVNFYQMFALTDDELQAASEWTSQGLCGGCCLATTSTPDLPHRNHSDDGCAG